MKILNIITGRTASGKTALAIELALKKGFEIISADSRQIYRYMDIGTGKPLTQELKLAKHHLIDIKNPDENYTAADFSRDAENILAQGNEYLIVGGTLFYIKTLTDGAPKAPPDDPEIKKELSLIEKNEPKALYTELCKVDPTAAKRIHENDSYRTMRAINVFRSTGIPYSEFLKKDGAKFLANYLVLNVPREEVYKRIDERVDKMVDLGLFDEVESLLKKGYSKELQAMNTLGYKEVIEFFDSHLSKEECIAQIKLNTRHFAKRQFTWLRQLKVTLIDPKKIKELSLP